MKFDARGRKMVFRNRCRSKTWGSIVNLMFFLSGVAVCFVVQNFYKEPLTTSTNYSLSREGVETLLVETVVERVKNDKRIQSQNLNTTETEFLVRNSRLREKRWRLVVVVMSTPKHSRTRKVIRDTWALDKPSNTNVYFAVGIEQLTETEIGVIKTENDNYGDMILLENFQESYRNLTQKLVETIKWLDKSVQTDFVMKVDEDSFVRLGEVVQALESKPKEKLYWGYFSGAAKIQKYGKWAEPDYFLCDYFLPYAVGGGYVISSDIVQYLAANADKLLIFKNEDVSMGTWLAPLNINRIHDTDFNTESSSRGCFNSYLVTHPHNVFGLLTLSSNLRKYGKLCSNEYFHYGSYIYNWTVSPYYCCERTKYSKHFQSHD